MRIRTLGLRRYGRFTDTTIDFGVGAEGEPDLHIVYGPNEAGKSTAMSACVDLLFGIQPQSRYNFLHPYPTMLIEAEIEQASGMRAVSRIKRPQNSLLDQGGQPIPEAVLLGDLGGLDRGAYQTMFCLDDETLEAGGESILASKGELGHLLFSATAGLAGVSHRLESTRNEADAFFKAGKRSGALVDLKRDLVTLKDAREKIDTLAGEFARLLAERDQTTKDYDLAIASRGRTQARIDEIRRFLGVLPRLVTLRALRSELESLVPLPTAPEAWLNELPELANRQVKLATQVQTASTEMSELQGLLDDLTVDAAALGLVGQLDVLADLRARYVTAEKDLPDRRLRMGLAEQAVATILMRVSRSTEEEPRNLVLTASTTGQLRDLVERRSGIDASLISAKNEVAKARAALADAGDQTKGIAAERDEAALRALAVAIGTARESDATARQRTVQRALAEDTAQFADRVLELRPWTGDGDALLALPTPGTERLEAWIAEESEILREASIRQSEVDRLEAEITLLEARLEALGTGMGPISDLHAAAARSARETAWATHRRTLDDATAGIFEGAMREYDRISEQRFGHTTGIADMNRVMLDRVERRVALDQAKTSMEKIGRRREALDAEIAAATSLMVPGIGGDVRAVDLKLWMHKRERALDVRARVTASQRELDQVRDEAVATRMRVEKALRAAGVPFAIEDDLASLIAAGQTVLDDETGVRARRKVVADRCRDLASREKELDAVRYVDNDWTLSWKKLVSTTWLGDHPEIPTVAAVKETLEAVTELTSALDKKMELTDRVAKMERDQSLFRTEVDRLANAMGLETRSTDPLGRWQEVTDRIKEAVKTRDERRILEERFASAKVKFRALLDELAEADAQASKMTQYFGVDSLIEVEGCLRMAARRAELQQRLFEAEREVIDAVRLQSVAEAETKLDALDRLSLEAELVEQKARLEDEDYRTQDLFSIRSKAEDRIGAVGGDAAVAALDEKRRTTLLEIEDRALAYLRLCLGSAAADKALHAYRDRHRSSMMTLASESFSLISRGAYTQLVTQPAGDSELLIANGSDGSSKIASELSKGTRFQLYLALRVAGYHEFAKSRFPAPFLADDIMETFDDFRAEEAFRLLTGMAARGQVVYFTHHRHLCDIARSVEPRVKIHHLRRETSEVGELGTSTAPQSLA
ncbi:AAA family ATPase [Tardiphaga sp. 813_E8_N1_3]|uniref:AAA family ATPase n=1 Tax=Tardiphaga sp. 813_E8_N1_3 TaxID=3240760 RepID=UPI003F238327